MSLPNELLEKIAQNLSAKADLRSFLLASRNCRLAALSPLYEHLNIDLRGAQDEESWYNMLHERNDGLKRIRKVAFGEGVDDVEHLPDKSQSSESNIYMSNKDTTMCELASRVLDLLPRNTLHEIRSPLVFDNPHSWYQKSFSTQCRVRSIHLRPIDPSTTEEDVREILASLPESFDKCIRLEVFPEDTVDLRLIAAIAPRVRKIEELKISPNYEMYQTEVYDTQMRDGIEMDTLQQALLCPTPSPGGDKPFPALRSLTLSHVDLSLPTAAYSKYLHLDTLRHLQLFHCMDSSDFLRKTFIGKPTKQTRLSSLFVKNLYPEDELTSVLDQLLLNIEGLVTLKLSIWWAVQQVGIASIQKHIDSLRQFEYLGSVWIDRKDDMDTGHTEISAQWAPEEMRKFKIELGLRRIRYHLPEHKVERGRFQNFREIIRDSDMVISVVRLTENRLPVQMVS